MLHIYEIKLGELTNNVDPILKELFWILGKGFCADFQVISDQKNSKSRVHAGHGKGWKCFYLPDQSRSVIVIVKDSIGVVPGIKSGNTVIEIFHLEIARQGQGATNKRQNYTTGSLHGLQLILLFIRLTV